MVTAQGRATERQSASTRDGNSLKWRIVSCLFMLALVALGVGIVHVGATGASWALYGKWTQAGLANRFAAMRANGAPYSAEQFTFFPVAVLPFAGAAVFLTIGRASWTFALWVYASAGAFLITALVALVINVRWAAEGHPYSNYLRGYERVSYAEPIIFMSIFCLVSAAAIALVLRSDLAAKKAPRKSPQAVRTAASGH